jgi:hypothetical protein
MKLETLRIVDPVLTSIAQGYRNEEHIGTKLFPIVTVTKEGGHIIEYGKEAFKLYNTRRAIRSNTARIDLSEATIPYTLEEESLESAVDDREIEEATAPNRPMIRATRTLTDIIRLKMEYDQAILAQKAVSYDADNVEGLSGTSQWSDYENSNPVKAIKDAREHIRGKIGNYPNTLILGASTFNVLSEHPKLIDKIKYSMKGVLTPALMAEVFNIKNVEVGKCVYAGKAGDFVDCWGNVAILAYVPDERDADMGTPAYGYTLRKQGRPFTSKYRDEKAESTVIKVSDVYTVKVTGKIAGFLFQTAVAL